MFLNIKASEKWPPATCLYNHNGRRKDSNPVWNFKKNKHKKKPTKPHLIQLRTVPSKTR